ncbi:hypothetical protein C4K40_4661 [Pseudomonas sp. CMR5c]|nr:hypothetical protein C4K40_4661 [Pseudomonas sp. CMR5c]
MANCFACADGWPRWEEPVVGAGGCDQGIGCRASGNLE